MIRKMMNDKWLIALVLGIMGSVAAVNSGILVSPSPVSATHDSVTVTQKCKGHWGTGFSDTNLGWADADGFLIQLEILPDCSDSTVVTSGVDVPDDAVEVVIFTNDRSNALVSNKGVSANCGLVNSYDGTKIKDECKAKGEFGTGKDRQKVEAKNLIEIR